MTFGQAQIGAVGAAALSKTQIGSNITLPAGGPWIIHGVWCQAIQDTAVANEAVNGNLIVDSYSGDINPDPAPGKYPVSGINSASSANFAIAAVPLNIIPVRWEASGKAVIQLSFSNLSGNATAPRAAAGILFGDVIPEIRPMVFSDVASATLTAAGETAIGTITLAEKATRIVGLMGTMRKDGAITVDEGMIGYFRMDSADIKFTPGQYPFDMAFSAADGTLAGHLSTPRSNFIPVDIPVEGGAIINLYGILDQAITAGVDCSVFIAYE